MSLTDIKHNQRNHVWRSMGQMEYTLDKDTQQDVCLREGSLDVVMWFSCVYGLIMIMT